MSGTLDRLVIVGGGTAGWLTACILAAKRPDLTITLIEAPDIPTIGVGEGTWPTMRETLRTIGIPETEFLRDCDASFKQGSRFDGWVDGSDKDSYLHPFTAPPAGEGVDLLGLFDQSDLEHLGRQGARLRGARAGYAAEQRQGGDAERFRARGCMASA